MASCKKLRQRASKVYIDNNHSLFLKIREIIEESSFLAKENNWDSGKITIRSTYDSFRIINIIEAHLNS